MSRTYFGSFIRLSVRDSSVRLCELALYQTPSRGSNSALPQTEALSKDFLRLACDAFAARHSFRAVFFSPAAVSLLIAPILTAIFVAPAPPASPGSARNPRPAAAKRRFAGGGGAQSQSKKASCGEGQGVYRRGSVGTERPGRIRGWRGAEEGRAARAANGSGWKWGREQRRVLAQARAGDSGPNRRRGRGDGEKIGRAHV